MKSACVFPGQGSQKIGMGEKLFKSYPELVEEADELLGYSIVEICLSDPKNILHNTEYTQPALFFVNALSYLEYIKNEDEPDYLAGHSLGEYNALVASGVLTFKEGLKLVSLRGKLMSEVSGGSMVAIIGLNRGELKEVLNKNFPELEIANYNSYTQNVISGPVDMINSSKLFFDEIGVKYIELNVSGAFHSSYMSPVQEKFNEFLLEMDFKEPYIPVLSNYTAKPYKIDTIRENLSKHLVNAVNWLDIIQTILKDTDKILQIGPGRALEGLTKRIKIGQ